MKKIHIERHFVVFSKKLFYNQANALLRCIEKADKTRLMLRRTAKGEEIQ